MRTAPSPLGPCPDLGPTLMAAGAIGYDRCRAIVGEIIAGMDGHRLRKVG